MEPKHKNTTLAHLVLGGLAGMAAGYFIGDEFVDYAQRLAENYSAVKAIESVGELGYYHPNVFKTFTTIIGGEIGAIAGMILSDKLERLYRDTRTVGSER